MRPGEGAAGVRGLRLEKKHLVVSAWGRPVPTSQWASHPLFPHSALTGHLVTGSFLALTARHAVRWVCRGTSETACFSWAVCFPQGRLLALHLQRHLQRAPGRTWYFS